MSWWNVPGSREDLTGDGPADAVDGAFLGLTAARQASQAEKPSLAELLSAVTTVLATQRGMVDGLPAEFEVVTREGLAAADSAPDDTLQAARQAIEGIRNSFQRDQQRKPRLAEILYAFTFALGGQPESILRPPFPRSIVLVAKAKE